MKIASLPELYQETLDCLADHILGSKIKPPDHVIERARFFLLLLSCDDQRKKMEVVLRYVENLPLKEKKSVPRRRVKNGQFVKSSGKRKKRQPKPKQLRL